VRLFAKIVEKGMVYRSLKPVYWCPGYETALARLRGPAGIELQVVQADGRRLVFRADPKRSGSFAGLAPGSGKIGRASCRERV